VRARTTRQHIADSVSSGTLLRRGVAAPVWVHSIGGGQLVGSGFRGGTLRLGVDTTRQWAYASTRRSFQRDTRCSSVGSHTWIFEYQFSAPWLQQQDLDRNVKSSYIPVCMTQHRPPYRAFVRRMRHCTAWCSMSSAVRRADYRTGWRPSKGRLLLRQDASAVSPYCCATAWRPTSEAQQTLSRSQTRSRSAQPR